MEDAIVQTASLADMVAQPYPRRIVTLHEFGERLYAEVSRARRFKLRISCLLVCLHGYDKLLADSSEDWVEAVLEEVGKSCLAVLRESDLVSRYAIDAFAVLLTHTDLRDAPIVAEKIMKRVHNQHFSNNGRPVRINVCIGMAQFPDVEVESATDFIHAAESALYLAEQRGPGTIAENPPP